MADKKDIDAVKAAIKTARATEKNAISNAKRKLADLVDEMVSHEHANVVDAIRRALVLQMSSRKIGEAYGSSDPHTIKRLINEAVAGVTSNDGGVHPEWKLTRNMDGTFTITAFGLGDAKLSGSGVFSIDEDGENFSLVDGDAFIAVQLYKLGQKDIVLEEARG
jgi:hypothetical protein